MEKSQEKSKVWRVNAVETREKILQLARNWQILLEGARRVRVKGGAGAWVANESGRNRAVVGYNHAP